MRATSRDITIFSSKSDTAIKIGEALEAESKRSGMGMILATLNELTTRATRDRRRRYSKWSAGDDAETGVAMAEYHEASVEQCRRYVIGRLVDYRAPVFPVRPSRLDDGDDDLVDKLRECRDTKRKDKLDYAAAFGRWRNEVFKAEARAASNLILLLSHVWHAREVDADDVVQELEVFLISEYGADVRDVQLGPIEVRRQAEIHCRRRDKLSDRLLPDSKGSKRNWKLAADHPARCEDPDDPLPRQVSIYEGQ